MRIFRGPATRPFHHSNTPSISIAEGQSHEEVDQVDASVLSESWYGSRVIRVEIDKDATMRSSVAHIVFSEEDVIALHNGLVGGLRESHQKSEEASRILSKLKLHGAFGLIDHNELSTALNKVDALTK